MNSTLKIAAKVLIVLREANESSDTKKVTRHKNARLGDFLKNGKQNYALRVH